MTTYPVIRQVVLDGTDVRTLEKLEERHDAAEVAEEARVEQLLADEVALRGREGQEP